MDIEAKRIKELKNALDKLYKNLESIKKETITHLGDKALFIIDFHANNWMDINTWINSKYNSEELMNIVSFQFFRLFKEIYWLQLLFHYGNYPQIYRNLRYNLELISQAYYIDSKYPNLSLDEQIVKTKEIEEKVYGWNLIKSVLCKINEQSIELEFKPLWNYLNKYIHPSKIQMEIAAEKDFSSLVTDSFNKDFSRDALQATTEIFDIINMIIFKKFPRIKEMALEYKHINEWQEYLPYTMKTIKK